MRKIVPAGAPFSLAMPSTARRPSVIHLLLVLVFLAAAVDPHNAAAEEPAEESVPVSLDQLLRLPDSYTSTAAPIEQRSGGAGREEWENRFRDADQALRDAELALSKAQAELDELAVESSQWQVAAPGSTDPQNSPLSFKLRQEIRRQREAIDEAKRRQRELLVEANLAEVPESWRDPAGSKSD